MKKGDIVTIYEDPITEKIPEGKAVLLRPVNSDEDLEWWEVRFKGEDDTYYRFIKTDESK